jgi:diguanylate cyclase (GGDEF)-like protein
MAAIFGKLPVTLAGVGMGIGSAAHRLRHQAETDVKAPIPSDEARRLAALHGYGILDAPADPDLEALTRLARHIAGTHGAVITLIDADRQVQAAATGMELGTVGRDRSMCAHVIAEDAPIHVADARDDPRFADSPFVTGEIAAVRLYASAPLRTSDGDVIGSLCVVDPKPGTLDATRLADLEALAHQVVQVLELRRHVEDLGNARAEVDHMAAHDHLTGLANRRRFMEEVGSRLRGREAVTPLVVYCDIDGFKPINDAHGNETGDQVLIAVAERLQRAVRHDDVVARIGDDEFAVLCTDLSEDDVATLLRRLREEVERPIATPVGDVTIGLSIGVARAFGAADVDDLLRAADEAMYDNKRGRRLSPGAEG